MKKSFLSSSVFALFVAVPMTASAQAAPAGSAAETPCPPGSWFCAEAPQQHATPAGQSVEPSKPGSQQPPLQSLP
ncbi:MAG: hypothetical protein ACREJ3_03535, partial [Polyangiaceae bacterium]